LATLLFLRFHRDSINVSPNKAVTCIIGTDRVETKKNNKICNKKTVQCSKLSIYPQSYPHYPHKNEKFRGGHKKKTMIPGIAFITYLSINET